MRKKLVRNVFSVALVGACFSGLSITGAAAASTSLLTSSTATSEVAGEADADEKRTSAASQPSSGVLRQAAANSAVNEGVGDVLGLGFEQRVTLDGDRVNIRDLTEKGETPLASFKAITETEYLHTGHKWPWLRDAGLLRPQLAVGDKAIYVTEPINNVTAQGSRVHRFERQNGEWVKRATAEHRGDHFISAIAVGKVAGNEVVAVGLNRSGVRVHDGKTLGEAKSGYEFGTDWPHMFPFMDAKRNMVSALAVGDRGDGVEVVQVGRMTYDDSALVQYPANGARTINGAHWSSEFRPLTHPWYFPTAFAMAGGEHTRDKAQLAVGYNGVNVKILSATHGNEWASSSAGHTRWLRFFDDVEGNQTLAAATDDGGRAYRYTPGQANQLSPQVIGAQGATVVDSGAFLNWFPGYKGYDVRVENASSRSIDVQSLALNDQARGCWLKGGLPNGTLAPGQASPMSRTGYYTATIPGKDGGFCAATSDKNMFVNVTPTGQPGQNRLIARIGADQGNLSIGPDFQITDGQFTASMVRNDSAGFSWTVKISDASSAPVIMAAPTVTGQRLTAEHRNGAVRDPQNPTDPMYPVFRIDVDDLAWQVPASTTRASAVVDAAKIEGITADGQATMLGYLKPATAPTLVDGILTSGPASFFVQNTKEASYTHVRVSVGGGVGAKSTTIDLAALTPPAAVTDSTVTGIEVSGQQGEGANITAFANGLDQAALTVGLRMANEQHLPASDPRYSRIYYRTVSDNRLITGLVNPAQPAEAMSITGHQGVFASQNTMMSASTVVKHFLTTTTHSNRAIKAVLGDTGTKDPIGSSDLYVTPQSTVPTLQGAGYYGLTAPQPGGGANLQLTPPTGSRPVPYDTKNPSTTGYQLKAMAMTGKGSLPLFTVGENKGHLTHVPLEFVNPTTVKVTAADFSFVGETFSAQVVTRGYLLTTEAPNHG